MSKRMIAGNMVIYSLSHALVDAACAATIFAISALGQIEAQNFFYLVMLYDVLAFATQPMFGWLVDKFKVPAYTAALGNALVAVACLLLQAPVWAAVLAGIGNALFHVGGGAITLNMANGKAALPGIFVAPGALGLMIGITLGKSGGFIAWPFLLLLAVSIVFIFLLPKVDAPAPRRLPANLKWFEAVIALLLVSVVIRSLVGFSLVMPWKADTALLIIFTLAVVLGKAFGGILADKFGWAVIGVGGLVISAPLLAFFANVPAAGIAGIFLFNLSMPITLICVAEMLPGMNGFAFGLTALALIIGALPTFTTLHEFMNRPVFIFISVLVSIAALFAALRLFKAHFHRDRVVEGTGQPERTI